MVYLKKESIQLKKIINYLKNCGVVVNDKLSKKILNTLGINNGTIQFREFIDYKKKFINKEYEYSLSNNELKISLERNRTLPTSILKDYYPLKQKNKERNINEEQLKLLFRDELDRSSYREKTPYSLIDVFLSDTIDIEITENDILLNIDAFAMKSNEGFFRLIIRCSLENDTITVTYMTSVEVIDKTTVYTQGMFFEVILEELKTTYLKYFINEKLVLELLELKSIEDFDIDVHPKLLEMISI